MNPSHFVVNYSQNEALISGKRKDKEAIPSPHILLIRLTVGLSDHYFRHTEGVSTKYINSSASDSEQVHAQCGKNWS